MIFKNIPMDAFQLNNINPYVFALATLWSLPWKGIAMWKAAKNDHKGWFIAILIFNTLAILDIIYILFFSKPKNKKQEIIQPPSDSPEQK